MLNIICSLDENNGLGLGDKLLIEIPADLQRFKALTSGHPILMGRKTFDSLPGVLPNRYHMVLSNTPNQNTDEKLAYYTDLDLMISDANERDKEVFIIGGAQLFELTLPIVDRLYITRVYDEFPCDVFFPKLDEYIDRFRKSDEGSVEKHESTEYQFQQYTRI